MSLIVRPAEVADARRISEIHVAGWQEGYRGLLPAEALDRLSVDEHAERRARFLSEPPSEIRNWLLEVDGVVEAWAGTGPCRDDDGDGLVELYALYVNPARWRGGFGARLFDHAWRDLVDRGHELMTLWVLTTNERGRRFYERQGMTPDGRRQVVELRGCECDEVRYRLTVAGA
ncbi:MAG: GNAT family N-acetyltransferase [Acidobacteriota bacterium]